MPNNTLLGLVLVFSALCSSKEIKQKNDLHLFSAKNDGTFCELGGNRLKLHQLMTRLFDTTFIVKQSLDVDVGCGCIGSGWISNVDLFRIESSEWVLDVFDEYYHGLKYSAAPTSTEKLLKWTRKSTGVKYSDSRGFKEFAWLIEGLCMEMHDCMPVLRLATHADSLVNEEKVKYFSSEMAMDSMRKSFKNDTSSNW